VPWELCRGKSGILSTVDNERDFLDLVVIFGGNYLAKKLSTVDKHEQEIAPRIDGIGFKLRILPAQIYNGIENLV